MGLPWYQHNVGDFLKDTLGMTFEQQGLYVRLRDLSWLQEQPGTLADNDAELARLLDLTKSRWLKHRPIVLGTWAKVGKRLVHDKLYAQGMHAKRKSESAKKGPQIRELNKRSIIERSSNDHLSEIREIKIRKEGGREESPPPHFADAIEKEPTQNKKVPEPALHPAPTEKREAPIKIPHPSLNGFPPGCGPRPEDAAFLVELRTNPAYADKLWVDHETELVNSRVHRYEVGKPWKQSYYIEQWLPNCRQPNKSTSTKKTPSTMAPPMPQELIDVKREFDKVEGLLSGRLASEECNTKLRLSNSFGQALSMRNAAQCRELLAKLQALVPLMLSEEAAAAQYSAIMNSFAQRETTSR